ncbi:VWA domain-containing protein [Tundrisphaera sp. TA3]|uniref:VWA domain-containing protein n=1 Tax=Tundrisphaera sp. TA3 TaxID=3435775 RepID=UPI003EBFC1DB
MSWGVANVAMLGGLAGVAIPIAIHLLSRRDEPVVDWGAMQFLELAPSQRRRVRFADALLMLARIIPLALAALALSRPYWNPANASVVGSELSRSSASSSRRDVVLILDGSAGMGRPGDDSPRDRAIAWARRFVATLRPGDSVAVLQAGSRVRPVIDPPAYDLEAASRALADAPATRGAGDIPSAIAEAFRILGRAGNPARDVIVLTDGGRAAWKLDEPGRWNLLRDLRARMPAPPSLWVAAFPPGPDGSGAPDGSVGPIALTRATPTPGMPVGVSATVANAGPGPMTRAAELVVDGRAVPGSSRVVGPIPPGGRSPVEFSAEFADLGDHLVAVRLVPGADPRPEDDESSAMVRVARPIRVVLIDGATGLGATPFLRAALAPGGDRSPRFEATSVAARAFRPDQLEGQDVSVLAGVTAISPDYGRMLARFVEAGGGLLLVPGPSADPDAWARGLGPDLLPAGVGPIKGEAVRPDPRSFNGPALAPLGRGETPALGSATFVAHRRLTPVPRASVLARLDDGDPWIVARPLGRGRVAVVATGLDAAAGTLVANPDFVPFAHELVAGLADTPPPPRPIPPGSPLAFDLDPAPPSSAGEAILTLPSGRSLNVPIARSGASARVLVPDTDEPGIYRLAVGGRSWFAIVGQDAGPADASPLADADRATLAAGWPLAFLEGRDGELPDRLTGGSAAPARREAAPALILAVLAGLCLEIALTRRMSARGGVRPS